MVARFVTNDSLTDEEIRRFTSFLSYMERDHGALVRGQLDGKDVAVIATVSAAPGGGYDIAPWAILLDDDADGLIERLLLEGESVISRGTTQEPEGLLSVEDFRGD